MKFAANPNPLNVCSHDGRAALTLVLSTALVMWSAAQGWAQEDPLGGSPPSDATPAAERGVEVDPTAPEMTPAEKKAAEEAAAERAEFERKVAAETDPLVRLVMQVKPSTPEQWMHDIRALVNLNRPEFAKEYLKQFLAVLPDAATLSELQGRYGTAFFLRLSSTESLQPEGTQVANAVMQAASDRLRDEKRLAGLVDQLSATDTGPRRRALVELVQAGPVAVPAMVAVLNDAGRAAQHEAVRGALVEMGEAVVRPLIAALDAAQPELKIQVIGVLEQLTAREAVPLLLSEALASPTAHEPAGHEAPVAAAARQMITKVLGSLPSREEAVAYLGRRIEKSLAGTAPGMIDLNDQVTVWVWDTAQQLLRQESVPADDAAFLAAARAARDRYQIDPTDRDVQRMYLATGLETAKRLFGYDRPLTEQAGPVYSAASVADPDVLEGVLQLALQQNMQGAAVAAIELLGTKGDRGILQSSDGQPRLLTLALVNPARRVQAAAAEAILRLDPTEPFPGCSYLPEVLGYLSAGGGRRRVLVGDPRVTMTQTLAGYLSAVGFEADTQQTGRDLILQAFESPDYSLVMLGDAIDHPRFREIVQTLRRDPRTADLPIGLMARDVNEQSAESFARRDPLTMVLAPPQTQQDVEADVQQLLQLSGRRQMTAQERTQQAAMALDALAHLAASPDRYGFYDLLKLDTQLLTALNTPLLAAKAIQVLGLLGTPLAQRTLVEFASSQMQPLADRQAAAAAFRVAVDRRGLLLTRDQLLAQYELYNRSEAFDHDTQQVLASILDTMEEPTRQPDAPRNNH